MQYSTNTTTVAENEDEEANIVQETDEDDDATTQLQCMLNFSSDSGNKQLGSNLQHKDFVYSTYKT